MTERSAIEWTDSTWNPWRGCDKVSPGCAACYMFRDQLRYGNDPSVVVRAADVTFTAPLKWRNGRMVFTCSWSDWFHEDADNWRGEAWDVIRRTPQHTYQILTKRPERIAECLPSDWGSGWSNVWLGTSIENRRFVWRADELREVPAVIRFISAEPLLGPLVPWRDLEGNLVWDVATVDRVALASLDLSDIDWVIIGGETGPEPRRMNLDWVRALRGECQIRDVAFFVKQLGGARPGTALEDLPPDLRIREWPQVPAAGALF